MLSQARENLRQAHRIWVKSKPETKPKIKIVCIWVKHGPKNGKAICYFHWPAIFMIWSYVGINFGASISCPFLGFQHGDKLPGPDLTHTQYFGKQSTGQRTTTPTTATQGTCYCVEQKKKTLVA